MKKKIKLTGVLILMVAVLIFSRRLSRLVSGSVGNQAEEIMVVLDPGHGGADPGKIGVDDSREKDINLTIAGKVKTLLEKDGISCKMTRTEDVSLAEDASGGQKAADMKERVRIINETKPELAVSIHQNSYTQEAIRGAQVFYYAHSKYGEAAAKVMQQSLREIDEDNRREAKANDTYYLLKKTEPTTLIVECGFLSNRGEAAKLQEDAYQEEVAHAIAEGIKACIDLRTKGTKIRE